MFDSNNYGCEVILVCDVNIKHITSTYAGFSVVRVDNLKQIAKFYEGDPYEDYDAALSYAQSITRHNCIDLSPTIDKFWKELGKVPKQVKR